MSLLTPRLTWKLKLLSKMSPFGVIMGTFSKRISSDSMTWPRPFKTGNFQTRKLKEKTQDELTVYAISFSRIIYQSFIELSVSDVLHCLEQKRDTCCVTGQFFQIFVGIHNSTKCIR